MKCIYVKRVDLEQDVDICPAPVELPIKKNRYFSEIKDINKTSRSLGL